MTVSRLFSGSFVIRSPPLVQTQTLTAFSKSAGVFFALPMASGRPPSTGLGWK